MRGPWGPGRARADGRARRPPSLQQGKSSSTGNLLDKEDLALPPPDYSTSSRAFPAQTAGTFKQRPYSVAVPAFSQVSWGPWQGPLMGGLAAALCWHLHWKAVGSGVWAWHLYPCCGHLWGHGQTPSIVSGL